MGKYWGWFLNRPTSSLLKMRERMQRKANIANLKIKAIDEEIERRGKEDKK